MIDFVGLDAAQLGLAGPRMSFERAGEAGPPVLLLHGIGANSMGWAHVLEGLAPVARVVAWNAPGYFLSDPFLANAPTVEAYADVALALALLDALALGSAALVAPGSPALPEVQRMVAATHAAGLMQAARCTDAVDVVADYAPDIRAPTLCITGALDGVNPPSVGQAVAAAIAGARYEEILGIGHLPEMELPQFTLKLLWSHMKIA